MEKSLCAFFELQEIKHVSSSNIQATPQTKHLTTLDKLGKVPGATQALDELLGNGASQRIFRKFIESSYFTLDPKW